MIPSAGTAADQVKLDRINARIERLEAACDNPHLRAVLHHATKYDQIGRLTVRVIPLPRMAGLNIPWTPGITIDREAWAASDEIVLQILVHETMHELPPYLGHWHIEGWVACNGGRTNELEKLMREVP